VAPFPDPTRSAEVNFRRFAAALRSTRDLVTQSQVLELERGTRSEDRRQSREECHKSSEHRRNCERCNSHPFRYFEVFERHNSTAGCSIPNHPYETCCMTQKFSAKNGECTTKNLRFRALRQVGHERSFPCAPKFHLQPSRTWRTDAEFMKVVRSASSLTFPAMVRMIANA